VSSLQQWPCAQSVARALLEAMLRELEEKGQPCPHALESKFYLLYRFDRVREAVHSRTSYGNRSTRCSACNLAHASQIAPGALLGAMLDYCRKRADVVHTHLHVSSAWFITSIDSAMHYKAAPVVCLCHKASTLQPCPWRRALVGRCWGQC
jgi:hypothetical protein